MLYMFLVVILFFNLLVAIIVDSYQLVGEHAKASFWTQRMLFILDVDQMQKLWNRTAKIIFCRPNEMSDDDKDLDDMDPNNSYYQNWAAALASFSDKRVVDENGVFASKFWSNFMRRCALIVIIPCWLLLGFVSAGYFWPPQVRMWLFFAKAEKENNRPTDETSASMKQLQTEILTANQTLKTSLSKISIRVGDSMKQLQDNIFVSDQTTSTGFDALNRKIDKLAFEMQQLKTDHKESKSELEDIKRILLSLSKNS